MIETRNFSIKKNRIQTKKIRIKCFLSVMDYKNVGSLCFSIKKHRTISNPRYYKFI